MNITAGLNEAVTVGAGGGGGGGEAGSRIVTEELVATIVPPVLPVLKYRRNVSASSEIQSLSVVLVIVPLLP